MLNSHIGFIPRGLGNNQPWNTYNHQPISMMVLSVEPLSFIAIARLARRLWDDTRSRVYPLSKRQLNIAARRTAAVIHRSNTLVAQAEG
jgi:hypothetical protein